MAHDLVIRGGTIVDGTGRPPYPADIALRDGRIAEIGRRLDGRQTLDAAGRLVTPGFIDLHTHYDPQVLWDPWLTPSSHLGVTSVIAGNCSFSIAPCAPEMRASMMRTMEAVEDMRVETLAAGVEWTFETYPEYLDAVRRQGTALNYSGFVGHTAVRQWVMGDAAFDRAATDDEILRMREVVADALRAGAIGFSFDRSPSHRGDGGRRVPSVVASQSEVEALMMVTRDLGRGVIQCSPGEDFHWLYEFQPRLERPITWTSILAFPPGNTARAHWADKIAFHREHGVEQGRRVYPQVTCRRVTATIKLTNPATFTMVPAWGEMMAIPRSRQREAYADPAWRERAWAETDSGRYLDLRWSHFSVEESRSEPRCNGISIEQLARDSGKNPVEVMCDLALADDLETTFGVIFANDDPVELGALLQSPGVVLGLSDAGAHVGQLCDATLPVDFLATWIRDRELMSLEAGVHKLTGEPASLLELTDRGRLTVGARADVVVRDWAALDAGPVRRVRDLPGDTDRLVAHEPRGIAHVIVNGVAIRHDNIPAKLDRLPGQILDNGARP
jgi:N-acyl-D-aspartate/D-glutamate deacylase